MAVKNEKTYECDNCHRKVSTEYDLTPINLPYFDDGEYDIDKDNGTTLDCCDECKTKIAKIMAKHIGYFHCDKQQWLLKTEKTITSEPSDKLLKRLDILNGQLQDMQEYTNKNISAYKNQRISDEIYEIKNELRNRGFQI